MAGWLRGVTKYYLISKSSTDYAFFVHLVRTTFELEQRLAELTGFGRLTKGVVRRMGTALCGLDFPFQSVRDISGAGDEEVFETKASPPAVAGPPPCRALARRIWYARSPQSIGSGE